MTDQATESNGNDLMNNCTHTTHIPGRWVDRGGDMTWKEAQDIKTVKDVDTHRYRCTKCGEIMYYSEKARNHFQNGVVYQGITGLDRAASTAECAESN